jgi:hypothetical protein
VDGEHRCTVGDTESRGWQGRADRTSRRGSQYGSRAVGAGDDSESAAHVLAAKRRAGSGSCTATSAGACSSASATAVTDAYAAGSATADSGPAHSGTAHSGTTDSGPPSSGTADASTPGSDTTTCATSSSEDGHDLRQDQIEFGGVSERDVCPQGRHGRHDASD